LFRYDPEAEGVFGSRISLDGNPASGEMLAPGEDDDRTATLADWALGQDRFESQFDLLADDAAAPTRFADWLLLDAKGRKGKTPFVATGDSEEEKRYAVSQSLADTAGQCLANWQTLQELAGVITPFTERLEEEIRAEVAAEHQAALDAQKQASDAEIKKIEEKTQAEIASKLRSRLLQLASKKRT